MILNTKQICSILVREGYGRWIVSKDTKKEFISCTCTLAIGSEGKHYLYLHSGAINSLKKHFKDVDNIIIHRVGRMQAQ